MPELSATPRKEVQDPLADARVSRAGAQVVDFLSGQGPQGARFGVLGQILAKTPVYFHDNPGLRTLGAGAVTDGAHIFVDKRLLGEGAAPTADELIQTEKAILQAGVLRALSASTYHKRFGALAGMRAGLATLVEHQDISRVLGGGGRREAADALYGRQHPTDNVDLMTLDSQQFEVSGLFDSLVKGTSLRQAAVDFVARMDRADNLEVFCRQASNAAITADAPGGDALSRLLDRRQNAPVAEEAAQPAPRAMARRG